MQSSRLPQMEDDGSVRVAVRVRRLFSLSTAGLHEEGARLVNWGGRRGPRGAPADRGRGRRCPPGIPASPRRAAPGASRSAQNADLIVAAQVRPIDAVPGHGTRVCTACQDNQVTVFQEDQVVYSASYDHVYDQDSDQVRSPAHPARVPAPPQ